MTRTSIVLAALVVTASVALAPAAAAQGGPMVCGERVAIVNSLQSGHDEQKTAAGLSGTGAVIELFTGDTGSWTLLLTLPGGPTCLLGAGEAWEGWPDGKVNGIPDAEPRNTSMPVLPDDLT